MSPEAKIFIHRDNYLYWLSETHEELLKISLADFLLIEPSYVLAPDYEEALMVKVVGINYDHEAKTAVVSLENGSLISLTTPSGWGRGQKLLERLNHYKNKQGFSAAHSLPQSLESLKKETLKRIGEIAESKYEMLLDGRKTEATFLWYDKRRIAKVFLETGELEEQSLKVEAMDLAKLKSDASVEQVHDAITALAREINSKYQELKNISGLVASARTRKREEVRSAATIDDIYAIDIYKGWPI